MTDDAAIEDVTEVDAWITIESVVVADVQEVVAETVTLVEVATRDMNAMAEIVMKVVIVIEESAALIAGNALQLTVLAVNALLIG